MNSYYLFIFLTPLANQVVGMFHLQFIQKEVVDHFDFRCESRCYIKCMEDAEYSVECKIEIFQNRQNEVKQFI